MQQESLAKNVVVYSATWCNNLNAHDPINLLIEMQ
jgi:hypothetical protein